MKNKEILRKIYYENRAINRNIQRLANISLIGLLARSAKKAKESDDEQGKNLAKAGLLLVIISEALIMISIMHVNNETGIIQPIKEIGGELCNRDVLFHVDATQSFGKLVDELREVNYNMLSMSAHKIGGPQGIGALVLRKQRYKLPPIKPIMYGGQQEHGIRPGTLPVALIAGLGKACEIVEKEYKANNIKCQIIKDKMISMLEQSGLEYVINGETAYAISSTLNICINGVTSEALMLSTKDFCGISNGSACNSKSYNPSYVLLAMGISREQIENSIRVSWGPDVELEEFEKSFQNIIETARRLIW